MSDKKKPSLAWIIKEHINPSLSNWVMDGTTTSGPNFLFESVCQLSQYFLFHVPVTNNWKRSKCFHKSKLIHYTSGVKKLGHFGGEDMNGRKVDGKEPCLEVCLIFALTGCQWDEDDGGCFAYNNEVTTTPDVTPSFCYLFDGSHGTVGMTCFEYFTK